MKKLLLKSILLLCALITGTSAWATDLTLDLSSNTGWTITKAGTSGTGSDVEMSKDGITINASKGYWEGSHLRVYSGSTFVVTSSIGNMSQIALTFTGSKTGPLSGYTEGTATVSPAAASYESSASGQARIVRIVVTYTAGAVANPIFDPAAGAVEKGTTVSITTATAGATIHYTTDGSNPTSSSTTYSSAITINTAQTIKAIAVKGSDESEVVTAAYTIKKVETPTFTVAEGDVIAGTTVEIETATAGATIHYTTDGSTPTSSSTTYSSAITIDADMTLKAIAVKTNWDDSNVASADYTVVTPVYGYSIDFETNDVSRYADWTFTNIVAATATITAHGGTYYANTDGKSTASITTKAKIANPGTFICYISKESGNTTASNWKIQTSENGTSWTDVATKSAKEMGKGEWQEFNADLSAYQNVYVRLSYGSNTAVRAVDDIVLTFRPAAPVDNGDNTITLTTTDNMNGWRTFYDASQDYEVDGNTKIYVVKAKSTNEDEVELTALAATAIPHGVPVILKTTALGHSMTLTETSGAAALGDNLLAVTNGTSVNGYRLGYKSGTGIAFYKYTATAPAAGIVYIDQANVNISSSAREYLTFSFDEENETTSVADVRAKMADDRSDFFDMQGRKVMNPTKGLYIVNGKKVVIK